MSATTMFGEVRREAGLWKITCEPHVRNLLRRVFPQVSQRASDVVTLSDSPENCRELLWFLGRYPMKVDGLAYMRRRSEAHRETETLIARLLAKTAPPGDFPLSKPPREYQKEAATLVEIKSGLLVADQVGLGKTITAICSMTRQKHLPMLVVCWPHLCDQWREKVEEFAPGLKVHVVKQGTPYDMTEVKRKRGVTKDQGVLFGHEEPRTPDIIICTYTKLSGWAETLKGMVNGVVFDEIQELRHTDSLKYSAARLVASSCGIRIGLSATPIYNYGTEFFNVIDILFPGALGTYDEFLREWCDGDRLKDTKAFGMYLRREGMMIRRTRKDVGRELPPCERVVHSIESDPKALERIKGSAVELARVILASQQQFRGQKFLANQEFDILMRQATGIAKAPYVAEFVKMLLDTEEKAMVFAWHREVYNILMELLHEFNPRMFTGSETAAQKEATKQAFLNGDCRVVLMSLRSGGGSDGFQDVCKVGVFAELDWSPGVHEQCEGRYCRDGQEEGSMSYFLLTDDGSDPIISEIVGIKKQQVDGVRDPDAELIDELEVDPNKVKRMAEEYLRRMGVKTPGSEAKSETAVA